MNPHESYYTSSSTPSTYSPGPPPVPQSPQSPPIIGVGQRPPPPPPPKSHDTSRTNTPTVLPVQSHPNTGPFTGTTTAAALPSQNHPSESPSQRPPPPPPSASYNSQSPVHQGPQAQNRESYQSHYQQQQQQPLPPPPPPTSTHPLSQQQSLQQQPPPWGQVTSTVIHPLPPLDSGWLPETLKEYSTADLQAVSNNSELLDAFAKQHPAYGATMEQLQVAISANLALAQHLVQLETQVNQLREQTGQLLLNHTSLQTQWRRKQSEMDDALSSWGPRAMYSRLVSSINEQGAILQAVHDSFVEGNGGEDHEFSSTGNGKATEKELTEWLKRIREGTTLLEKRREMRQRWDDGRVGGWR